VAAHKALAERAVASDDPRNSREANHKRNSAIARCCVVPARGAAEAERVSVGRNPDGDGLVAHGVFANPSWVANPTPSTRGTVVRLGPALARAGTQGYHAEPLNSNPFCFREACT
jgi:hypothetical protein